MWGRKGIDLLMLRGIAGVKKLTGVDLKAAARSIRLKKFDADTPLSEAVVRQMKNDLLVREARVRDMFEIVDCFIAPSRHLMDLLAEFGLDRSRMVYSDYGTDLQEFARRRRSRRPSGGPLRIGFLGSVQPVKGVHVLLQALQDLDPRSYEAFVWGNADAKPEYRRTLQRWLTPSITLAGPVEQAEVADVLASTDVLVVPSIWWENSPLVIHEAFAAGVPVVCSDVGGMAELVQDGVSGLHFRTADPSDLARRLQALIDDPRLIDHLRAGIPKLKDISRDAAWHSSLYEAVIAHHDEVRDDEDREAELFD